MMVGESSQCVIEIGERVFSGGFSASRQRFNAMVEMGAFYQFKILSESRSLSVVIGAVATTRVSVTGGTGKCFSNPRSGCTTDTERSADAN